MDTSITAATASTTHEQRAVWLIYAAAFGYMITYGLMNVAVPLYGLHLGYDLAELGVIIGSQAAFGLALRLFAGAIADRFGERWVLWFSFGTAIAAGLIFAASGAFVMLIVAQLCFGFSRATYWTATQSYASRINASRSHEVLGRISGSGNAGQVAGTFTSGLLIVGFGYPTTFLVGAGVAVAGLVIVSTLPTLSRKAAARSFRQVLAPVPGFFKDKGMTMSAIAAFFASTGIALTLVIVIPHIEEVGYSESANSTLRTLLVMGSIATGMVFGKIMARTGEKNLYTYAFALLGLTLIIIPQVSGSTPALVAIMVAYGIVFELMAVGYTVTTTHNSRPEQRGVAMAYVGLYWGLAQLIVPTGFGLLGQAFGLQTTFWVAGGIFIAASLANPMVYAWLVEKKETLPPTPTESR
jgi:MFS transporter, DHA1 family, multidrug resistance protein